MTTDTKMDVQLTYSFKMTAEDFRVMMAALRHAGEGVPFKKEFKKGAVELQKRLFRIRGERAKVTLDNLQKMHRPIRRIPDIEDIEERHHG